MKEIITELKEARISILRARHSLNYAVGREVSIYALDQADKHLEETIERLHNEAPEVWPGGPVNV